METRQVTEDGLRESVLTFRRAVDRLLSLPGPPPTAFVLENVATLISAPLRWVLTALEEQLSRLPYAHRLRGVHCPSQVGGNQVRARLYWVLF